MRWALAVVVVLAAAADATAHAPTTAIGRAVAALEDGSVSYDPGSVVTDLEAANFAQVTRSRVAIAFLPYAAASEIPTGSPSDIAAEIAHEAELDGTVAVLVGARAGA